MLVCNIFSTQIQKNRWFERNIKNLIANWLSIILIINIAIEKCDLIFGRKVIFKVTIFGMQVIALSSSALLRLVFPFLQKFKYHSQDLQGLNALIYTPWSKWKKPSPLITLKTKSIRNFSFHCRISEKSYSISLG